MAIKIRNAVFNFILIIISLVVVLVVSELGIKLFYPINRPRLIVKRNPPPRAERALPFLKPFFEATFLSAEYTTRLKHNSQGFRDSEYSPDRPKDTFRILVAGDSFTYGLGVEADQTYAKVLEDKLNRENTDKYKNFEVLNLGIAGVGTIEEMEIIEYSLGYKPDLVILGIFVEDRWNPGNGNDLADNLKRWQEGKQTDLLDMPAGRRCPLSRITPIEIMNSLQRFLANHSDLYFLLMTRIGTPLRKFFITFRQEQGREQLNQAWRLTLKALEKINSLCKKEKIPMIVVRIPFLFDVYDKGQDHAGIILSDFAVKNKILFFDLLPDLRKTRVADLYYPADGHWKALAHKLAADSLWHYLIENNVIAAK